MGKGQINDASWRELVVLAHSAMLGTSLAKKKKKKGALSGRCKLGLCGHSVVFGGVFVAWACVSSLHWAFVESGFDDTAADSVLFILTRLVNVYEITT